MLPTWENRPQITANLNNPAFCCELLRVCAHAYGTEASTDMPFSLCVLVLPLVLPRKNRVTLPKTKSTRFHAWINDNEELKVRLSDEIKSFLPFSKETLMFGMSQQVFTVSDAGGLVVLNTKTPYRSDDPEVKECVSKSNVLGKVLAMAGTVETVYSLLGLKP